MTDTASPTSPNPDGAILSGQELGNARLLSRLQVADEVTGLLITALMLIVWVPLGASAALRDATGGDTTFLSRVAFVVAFMVILNVIDLGPAIFFNFLPSRSLGLLKVPLGQWVVLWARRKGFESLIDAVFWLGILYVLRAYPQQWLLLSMGVVTLLFLASTVLTPLLIKLNYKTEPLGDAELERMIRDLATRSGVKIKGVSKLMMGEKTRMANAMIVENGRGSEVILSDTLLAMTDHAGVEVVLAHEFGHKAHRHILKDQILQWMLFAGALAFAAVLIAALGNMGGLRGPSDVAALPLLMVAFTVVQTFGSVLKNAIKRRNEFAADRYALELTGNVDAFERFFRAAAQTNLSDPDLPRWVEVWLHDHPSIGRRIAAARAWAEANPDKVHQADRTGSINVPSAT